MQNLPLTVTYQVLWNLAVQLSGRTPDNVPQKESDMLQSFFAAELEDLWRKEAWPELCDNLMPVTVANNVFANPYISGLTVTGAGNAACNGTYTSPDGLTWTNAATGATITFNAGTWTIISGGFSLYTLVNATPTGNGWAAGPPGSAPAPTSAFISTMLGDILGIYTLDPRSTPGWRRLEAPRVWSGNNEIYVNTCLQTVWVDWQLPCVDLLDPTLVGVNNQAALNAATLPGRFRLPLAFRGAALLLTSEDPVQAQRYLQMAEIELARQASRLTTPWWRIETGVRC